MGRWIKEGILVGRGIVGESIEKRCSRRYSSGMRTIVEVAQLLESGAPRVGGIEEGRTDGERFHGYEAECLRRVVGDIYRLIGLKLRCLMSRSEGS